MQKNIGKMLSLIRKHRGLTLRELGDKTGIAFSLLNRIEHEKETPSIKTLDLICGALDINIDEFSNTLNKIDQLFDEFLDSLFYYEYKFDYFTQAINVGKQRHEINYSYGKIKLMEYLIYTLEEKFDKAEKLEKHLFEFFKNEFNYEAILFQYKGVSYLLREDYENALFWLKKAESQMINEKNKALLFYHIGIAYADIGEVVKATEYIKNSHIIFSEYGSIKRATYCLLEKAMLRKMNSQFDEAISYFESALKALKVLPNNEQYIARTYRNMCWTMILAKDYQKALDYLDEADSFDVRHGFVILYGIWCNYKLNNIQEAKKWIHQGLYLCKDDEFKDFYIFLSELVDSDPLNPSDKVIQDAINIVENKLNHEKYERFNFYLDIVLDLLNKSGRVAEKVKYLEMKTRR